MVSARMAGKENGRMKMLTAYVNDGVMMDSLSPEKQYISGTELQISSLPWGFNKVC